MRVLKQLGADLGRILAAIFGTAVVLVVTSGVGEGIAEAADHLMQVMEMTAGDQVPKPSRAST